MKKSSDVDSFYLITRGGEAYREEGGKKKGVK